ncbi:MAG: hypothetical protein BRC27_01735 [Nanohaloarchaea archaeon SW_10_44_10]|nr:MAG: hypothetical protein BRC27_01735 [Nanohaloarchaea archaeon SW_10_44_10]
MSDKRKVHEKILNVLNDISERFADIAEINRREAQHVDHQSIINELEKSETDLEDFEKHIEGFEKAIEQHESGNQTITDEEEQVELLNVARTAMWLSEEYCELIKDLGREAVENRDEQEARLSLRYLRDLNEVLKSVEELCKMIDDKNFEKNSQTIKENLKGAEFRPSDLNEEREGIKEEWREISQLMTANGLVDSKKKLSEPPP